MLEKVSCSQKFDPRTGRQTKEAALQVVTEGGASSIITRTPDHPPPGQVWAVEGSNRHATLQQETVATTWFLSATSRLDTVNNDRHYKRYDWDHVRFKSEESNGPRTISCPLHYLLRSRTTLSKGHSAIVPFLVITETSENQWGNDLLTLQCGTSFKKCNRFERSGWKFPPLVPL